MKQLTDGEFQYGSLKLVCRDGIIQVTKDRGLVKVTDGTDGRHTTTETAFTLEHVKPLSWPKVANL